MSVEAPKPVEETPVVEAPKALPEQPAAPSAHDATTVPPVEAAEPVEATPAATEEAPVPAPEEVNKGETIVEAIPATDGVLGFKEPTLLKKFFFTKHFFWFSEEPLTAEALSPFLRSEKADKHSLAAWARETGKGLLFYTKRAEDKPTPAGIINLADSSSVVKEGFNQFSFKSGGHQLRFEATKAEERDSWVVAIEKSIEEAKGLKEELTGSESYKKNVEEYSKPPVYAAAASQTPRAKSKEPKKSLDATTATAAAAVPVAENPSTSTGSADEATKSAKKERSQSRKRGSIFGTFLGKKEEHAELKEEKKVEAEEKKEEAKATEEPSKPLEAAEASAAIAVPAVVVASDKKEEEATPAEKKNKRGSVFGSLFKNLVTSPTTEKTEKDATASTDVPPVSETAPKLEEPIENKPIDTAAVTAPVDTVETPAATTEEPATATPAVESSKTEKKGGLLGFIKKTEAKLEGKKEHKEEAKEESKEEKAPETIAKDPVAAASAEPTTETAGTEPVAETPVAKEERPARDNKRRTSLFFNKKRTETSDAEDGAAETKREKSPTPAQFIGNLVRRASKAVKSEGPKEKTAAEPATTEPTTTEAPAVEEAEESKIVGDVVPEDLHAPVEPATPVVPEVKATA